MNEPQPHMLMAFAILYALRPLGFSDVRVEFTGIGIDYRENWLAQWSEAKTQDSKNKRLKRAWLMQRVDRNGFPIGGWR